MMDVEDLDEVLAAMMRFKEDVSDLNFSVGRPPQVEVDGRLEPVTFSMKPEPLTEEETEAIAMALLNENFELLETLKATGSVDCGHTLVDGSRVRVNIFKVRGNYSIVLRALPWEAPTIQQLGLPPILESIAQLQSGLVVVTGATGSGKSTTMTALLDLINRTRPVHIITLEDPIEYVHEHKLATINQRELGADFTSFASGIRAALRQTPRVVFVGEIRDRDTVEIALKAAETGSLVLSTLHTIDAGQTIHRITGLFGMKEQGLIRSRLADVLRFAIGQRLLPRERGGRVAAVEVMGSNLRVRELIHTGETEDRTYQQVIEDSRAYGWQSFDQHIVDLYKDDVISDEVALNCCSDRSSVEQKIDRIRISRGENTSELGDLQMDFQRRIQP